MCLNVYNCVCYLLLPFYFLGKFFELFINLFGIQKTFPGQNVAFMMTGSKPTIFQCAGFVSLLNECDRIECISGTFRLSCYDRERAGKSNNITCA